MARFFITLFCVGLLVVTTQVAFAVGSFQSVEDEALYHRAVRELHRERKFAEAQKTLGLLIQSNPDNCYVWLQSGMLCRELKDVAGARKAFEKAIACAESEDFKKAVEEDLAQLPAVVAVSNRSADFQQCLDKANLALQFGDTQRAREFARKADSATKETWEVKLVEAHADILDDQLADAAAAIAEAERRGAPAENLSKAKSEAALEQQYLDLLAKGKKEFADKDYRAALRTFSTATEVRPNCAVAFTEAISAAIQAGSREEADRLAEQMQQRFPQIGQVRVVQAELDASLAQNGNSVGDKKTAASTRSSKKKSGGGSSGGGDGSLSSQFMKSLH